MNKIRVVLICAWSLVLVSCSNLESDPLYLRYKQYEDFALPYKSFLRRVPSYESRHSLDELEATVLLGDVRPLHYDIRLQVYQWSNASFLGSVTVDLEAMNDTSTIVLHSLDLHFNNITVVRKERNEPLIVTDIKEFLDKQQLVISVKPSLLAGHHYSVSIQYNGTVRTDDNMGLYIYSYEENKQRRLVVATQLQTVFARTIFPCLDEPLYKARFTLHLARPTNSTALSNSPLNRTEPFFGHNDYVWDTFDTTEPMSTYLLAFVISQFDALNSTVKGIDYKVMVRPEFIADAQHAFDVTPPYLEFFQDLFDIPYPLTKLDSVILEKLGPAGMENWGLITYHESAARVNNGSSSKHAFTASTLVAHEVAHQWFGNLVTAKWWSDIWLNEGFATYMSILAVDQVEPQFSAMELFVSSHQMAALAIDSTVHSVPVFFNITKAYDVEKAFNPISYRKGASLIRMMDTFLTSRTFMTGIKNYLLEFQYGVADQNDLWHHLDIVGHKDLKLPWHLTVKEIMDTWTLQKHYPVVTVRRFGNDTCLIMQKPFLDIDTIKDYKEYGISRDSKWWIPLSLMAEGDVASNSTVLWLPPTSQPMVLAGVPKPSRWMLLNIDQTAYARINYDASGWSSIIRQLFENHQIITTATRAQLLDDAFHLFMQQELKNPDVLFTMMKYLENEQEYLPWVVTMRNLEDVENHMFYQEEFSKLQTYLLKLSSHLYFELGLAKTIDNHHFNLLTQRAMKWNCKLQLTECEKDLLVYFDQWTNHRDVQRIPSHVRTAALCRGVRYGNSSVWESIWEELLENPDHESRASVISALACTEHAPSLKRYVMLAIEHTEEINVLELYRALSVVGRSPKGYEYPWMMLKNENILMKRFARDVPSFIVAAATQHLHSRSHLNEVTKFLQRQTHISDEEKTKIIQQIEKNVHWRERYHIPISSWLNRNYPFTNMKPSDVLNNF